MATVDENTALAEVPEWMREDARLGKENIATEDKLLPRLQLLAAISPVVTDGKGEAGHFYHTILEEDLGDTLDITILHHSKRWTLWKPRHQGGGILARASDGVHWDNGPQEFADIQPVKERPRHKVVWSTGPKVGKDIGLGAWGTSDPENEDSAPAATLSHVLICRSPTIPGPFAILLQRTGERVAKTLLSKIDLDRAPIFGQRYTLGVKVDSNGTDEYFQYTFTKAGYVSAEEYAENKALYEIYVEQAPKVDDREDPEAERGSGDDNETGDGNVDKDDKY